MTVTSQAAKLSPRQRECLRLVRERQATSKEIAAALGISKGTVDNYIREAVDLLGARDRREAAEIAWGGPRPTPAESTVDSAGVGGVADNPAAATPSMNAARPWRQDGRRNAMTLGQTLVWILVIAVGSVCVLSLAVSVGNGLRPIARPALATFDRLTR
jgi:DNA-binding CsgD family transcriptional regulator